MLATYASNSNKSKGRLHKEQPTLAIYSAFEIDKNRIIESTAFRRLEYKTQVFVNHEGDHYRNRLTHSLEAAQIARTISKALQISSDLAETLTLAHDLGHAPFGHAGEDALNEVMQEYGEEFDHNAHTIKLLTKIEKNYPQFDGLNLTWETLEGITKHNGPILHPSKIIASYSQKQDLALNQYPSLEAQISSYADDIAYNNHDIDDGFRANLLTLEELSEISNFGQLIKQVKNEYPKADDHRIVHEAVQRMKNLMILDLIETTKKNLEKYSIKTIEDIYLNNNPIAMFSENMEKYHQQIKKFLFNSVYKHYTVNRMANKAHRIIKELFYLYMDDISCLPPNWQVHPHASRKETAIMVCDFIACMTDRYAISEYHSFMP